MVMRVQPGVYYIRNLKTNGYLNPESGYSSAGRKIFLESWVQQGSLKWIVAYNSMNGTYWIKSYVSSQYYLVPGIPPSRARPPQLELNDEACPWVIADTPNGNGFFIVKGDEQDQVIEADAGGPGALLNDFNPSRAEKRQIWEFVAAQ
ncbi:hypothetical protein F5051DRAFT_505206 [Lentinula edodes]|nr:hypothetical protein F5051DRAFT_505206 [Lentinula edodes]